MLTILIILLVIAACGGFFWGNPAGPGYARWSPLGIILVILLIMWVTGSLGDFGGGDYHRHFRLFR